jgi:hypothetical protein
LGYSPENQRNAKKIKMKNGVPCIYSSGSKLVVNAGGGGAWTAEGQGKGQSGSEAEGEGKCERTAGRGPIHAGTSGPLL